MKANELRIGNLVYCHYLSCNGFVSEVNNDSVKLIYPNKHIFSMNPISQLEPIQLTEDWLLKFGFSFLKKKDGTQGVYSNGKMNLVVSNGGNIYRINKLLPHVHQLQNLYFALTGEELTIK